MLSTSTAAVVIPIPNGDEIVVAKEGRAFSQYCSSFVSFINKQLRKKDAMKRLTHSIKVGIALVVVSLFYLRDPLKVGDNAMWAIMTVVVVFESSAGATLAKGINRGFGTILGGGLGCGATILAKEFGGMGSAIIIVGSVFVFGTSATYARSIPWIKRSYDYGAMIFVITFNIVMLSGLHAQGVLEIARDRVATICVGFGICLFTSLFVFPAWASEELHQSIASKFEKLSCSIEGSLQEGFRIDREGNHQPQLASLENCNDVLNSKSQDQTLVNFSRWEPWHGKFGLHHPCDRYFHIGEALREMAASTLSLNRCLHSARQTSPAQRQVIKGPCEIAGALLVQTLRELGQSIVAMRRYRPQGQPLVASTVQSMRLQLSLTMLSLGGIESGREGLAIASVVFLLGEMTDQLEALAKEVEDLGEHAGFHAK